MNFDAVIDGDDIRCSFVSQDDIPESTWCFSLMASAFCLSGGDVRTECGGYMEIDLPPLKKNKEHIVTLTYDRSFGASRMNRAWLPLGSYLRVGDKIIKLKEQELGVDISPPQAIAPFDGLKLVPQPQSWIPNGDICKLDSLGCNHPDIKRASDLFIRQGFTTNHSGNSVPIEFVDDTTNPNDGYKLEITPNQITISAASSTGYFYAGVTLMSLISNYNGKIPCGIIDDFSRFEWRGQHLDCARHFYSVKTIKTLIDRMAMFKMNVFHWHFSDDEAFRIEIDTLPELWQKTKCRGENQVVPSVFGAGIKSCGTYSKQDVFEVIAHAKLCGIDILPEIEVPAHALALNRIYPECRDPNDTGKERSVQGYSKNVLNPAMPKTFEIVEKMIDGIVSLFPIGILHLGCDELPKNTWAESPAVKKLMQEHGLENTKDVQGWFMYKVGKMLQDRGIRPAAWEEAIQGKNGGIGHDALLFSWTAQGPGLDAARAGYKVVMSPAQHTYFDMAHSSDANDWGASWAATFGIDGTVDWDPVPDDEPELEANIIGVESTYWGEFTQYDDQIWPMIFPRLLGVAQKAWSPKKDSLDGQRMRALVQTYYPLFENFDWQYYPAA